MRAEEINTHARKHPFEPFRIFLSDGSSLDVRHSELIVVTRTNVYVAIPSRRGGLPDKSVWVDPIHVTRVELINGHRRRGRH
jgi:hypothetical protein